MRIGIPLALFLTGTLFVLLARADVPVGWPLPPTAPPPPPVPLTSAATADQDIQDKTLVDAYDWLYGPANVAANRVAIAGLQRPMTVNFDNQGVERALNHWASVTGANIVPNWKALEGAGIDRNSQITLNLPNAVPAYKVLDAILQTLSAGTTNLDWSLDSGIITVSTRDDLNSAKYQTVLIYDIRDLVCDPRRDYDEQLKEVVELIKSVAAPDTWRDNGGTIGSIREVRGRLIINQVSSTHRIVLRLLEQFRASEGRIGRFPVLPGAAGSPNPGRLVGRTYEAGK